MEVDIAVLKEGEKSVDFLVVRDVFHKGDEGIPHGHVVGIGFTNKADRRLGVDGAI